jgi:hypothetical protein
VKGTVIIGNGQLGKAITHDPGCLLGVLVHYI